jgi:predicted metalloprotease with PDZ domain
MDRGVRIVVVAGAVILLSQGVMARASSGEPMAPVMTGLFMTGGASHMAAPGYLGVDFQDVGDERVSVLKLKDSHGAEIIHVDHDAPAGHAGLQEHDVILQLNGQAIDDRDQLRKILHDMPVGRAVTLVISRDGVQQTISTQMASREQVERQAWKERWIVPEPEPLGGDGNVGAPARPETFAGSSVTPPTVKSHSFIGSLTMGSSYTGAMVETMGPQLADFFGTAGVGVLVHSVDANSPAADAGLRAGDVVIRVNDRKMMSQSDWTKVIRENKGRQVAVVVLREKKEQTLTLVPDGKKRSSLEELPGEYEKNVVMAMRSVFSAW